MCNKHYNKVTHVGIDVLVLDKHNAGSKSP